MVQDANSPLLLPPTITAMTFAAPSIIAEPPFRFEPAHAIYYHPISVACLRQDVSFNGARFAITHRPPVLLSFGTRIQLNARYLEPQANGNWVEVMIDPHIRGTIFALASVAPYNVEFVLTNDGPGNPFIYLVVPLHTPGFLGEMPLSFWNGYNQLLPLLYCTYFLKNNERPLISIPDDAVETRYMAGYVLVVIA